MVAGVSQRLRVALVPLLLTSWTTASGGEPLDHLPPPRPVARGILYRPEDPSWQVPAIYVSSWAATLLKFEQPTDPRRTKLLGWEGRFESLVVSGKYVVVDPLHALSPEDRFLLLVTLKDGTEMSFTITAQVEVFDHQVDIFSDPDLSLQALHWRASDAFRLAHEVKIENERLRKEALSTDRALAGLLATGSVKQTPFQRDQARVLKKGPTTTVARLYRGHGKAAVVFEITNHATMPNAWRLQFARLSVPISGEERPFTLQMDRPEIPPGATGTIAIVVDRSAFTSEGGPCDLVLQLFNRDRERSIQAQVNVERRLAEQ